MITKNHVIIICICISIFSGGGKMGTKPGDCYISFGLP